MAITGHREFDRGELIARARRFKREIEQIFRDTASYNANHLPPGEPPLEADPGGEMARCLEYCNRVILGEMFAD